MALAYLLCPTFQIVNSAGKPATGGYLEVYLAGSRTKYFCSSDFDGTRHPFQIPLDSLGSNVVLADDAHTYDVYVYNRYGTLLMSRYGVSPGAGGGAGFGVLTSSDGSLTIVETANGYDLSVNGLETSALIAGADQLISDGQFVFEQLSRDGTLLSVDRSGKVRMSPAWYHFTAIVELAYDGTPVNESHQVTLWTTLSNSVIDLDTSYAHRESIELSGDIHVVGTNVEFPLGVSGLDTGITASLVSFNIHAVTGKGDNSEYHAGEGITINDATKTISADFDSVQEKLVAGENISITGNVISSPSPVQVNSDWDAEEGEPGYIENKPDLDVYATQAQLTYGLAGKQDVISDLSAIRSGAQAGASAVQPADLAAVATTGDYNSLNNRPNLTVYATKTEVNTGLAAKQDVISDLSVIRSGALAGSTAVQPGDLATVATTGSYDDLVDKPSIPAAQVNSDWDATSGVTAILNRPNLATVATTGDYTDLVNKPSIPAAQVNADWDATSGVEQILNRPNLATVATTGDYNDLVNTPVIPSISVTDVEVDGVSVVNAQGVAEITMPTVPTKTSDLQNDSGFITLADVPAQENADWDSTSGASQILNKPDLSIYAQSSSLATVATTGDYDDLNDTPDLSIYAQSSSLAAVATTGDYDDLVNKPSIPAAQVNADWNSSSGVSQILNRPNLATVATTGAYSDLSGTPTINNVPAVTSSDNDKVLKASYSGGVGSYSWQTEQGGGSTYTAGDAIDITNDEISVLYDSDTLKLKSQQQTVTLALGTWNENYGRAYAETNSDLRDILEGTAGWELTLHIPANTFYLNGTYGENIVLRISDDQYFNYSNYCLTPLAVTYDSVENKTWIDEQDIILHTPDQDPDYWYISNDPSARYVAFGPISSSNLCTITSVAAGDNVTVTYTHAGGDPLLAVKNPLPASAIGDATKVLTVDNNGAPVWATAQAPISAGTGIDITNNVVSVDNTVAMKSDLPAAYTAGDGISIANNEISAKAGTGLEIADVSETTTDNLVCAAMSSRYESGNWAQDICPMTQALADAMNTSAGYAFTLVKPFDTWNVYAWPAIAKTSELLQGELQNYAFFGNYLSCRPSTDGSDRTYEVPAGTTLTLKFSERDQFSTITVADILADLSSYSLVILWYEEDYPYAAETMLSSSMTPETTATHTATTTLQDALCVSNPLPASTVSDVDKVLKVNSSGAPEWATGGGDDGADWDAEQGEPGYIENKPVPKTLTAGAGISITENASTITIANTVTPPTVDQTYSAASTNAQSGTAVAEALDSLGTDRTVIMNTPQASSTSQMTLTEPFSNFEYIEIYATWDYNGVQRIQAFARFPGNQTVFNVSGFGCANRSQSNYGFFLVTLDCSVSGTTITVNRALRSLADNSLTSNTDSLIVQKIVGIHRVASN